MKLTIVTTGGTIDKVYFDAKSDYQIGEPQIAHILRELKVGFEYDIVSLMRKDSLELDDADRQRIRDTIAGRDCDRIIVTHGTDTMVETARVLEDLVDRTIVMTGSLNPARFVGSDAVFNIGCAVGAVQCLPRGTWIAMNGRIWAPGQVRKNRDANRFEAL